MTKTIAALLLFLAYQSFSYGQNAQVSGTLTDNQKAPLMGVNISLNNTIKGTQTNEDGYFELAELQNGTMLYPFPILGLRPEKLNSLLTTINLLTLTLLSFMRVMRF